MGWWWWGVTFEFFSSRLGKKGMAVCLDNGITEWSQIDKNYIPHVRIIVIIFISLCNRHMRGLGKLGKKKGSEEGEGVVSYRIWTYHVIGCIKGRGVELVLWVFE